MIRNARCVHDNEHKQKKKIKNRKKKHLNRDLVNKLLHAYLKIKLFKINTQKSDLKNPDFEVILSTIIIFIQCCAYTEKLRIICQVSR